jgi:hypothetical protein
MTQTTLMECKAELATLEKTRHQYTTNLAIRILDGRITNLKKLISKYENGD